MLSLSQQKLGDLLSISFQQVQKYERGTNRISASMLHQLSGVLDVPVSFFFDDVDPVRAPPIAEDDKADGDTDLLQHPETIELVEAYYQIGDTDVRRRLVALAEALVSGIDREQGARADHSDGRPRRKK